MAKYRPTRLDLGRVYAPFQLYARLKSRAFTSELQLDNALNPLRTGQLEAASGGIA